MELFLLERINRTIDRLNQNIYLHNRVIENIEYRPNVKKYEELKKTQGMNCHKNVMWEGQDQYGAFSSSIIVPEHMQGEQVILSVYNGREGQWDADNPQFAAHVNGKIIQGVDLNHKEVVIAEKAVAGEKIDIDLIGWMGNKGREFSIKMSYAVCSQRVRQLYYDILVPYQVARLYPEGDKNRQHIEEYLNEACNMIDFREEGKQEFYNSIDKASQFLKNEFYEKFCGNNAEAIVHSLGHTHIDVAWLWDLEQTRHKTVRSFSTVIELMRRYKDYKFMSSQPQLYKYFKQEAPEKYQEVKELIRQGRWEAEGAMWLEADCNLSSGESLIRQILFGKRFFKEEFSVDNKILWLPDVFGYSASLPQILKKTGIDYFLTSKISWNETNKMPYDTFMWKGIDGTEILTYFITTANYPVSADRFQTTYTGNMTPAQVKGTWERYQPKRINDNVLTLFGFGDGGGGTTTEMIETYNRLHKGIPGCPKTEMTTGREFFEILKNKVQNNKRLPKWSGELYLELHRGTYTTMSRNKKYNRKSEFIYQDIELFSMLNKVLCNGEYPQQEINDGWEIILLNQFHDIIPGSSIKEVYDESKVQYENILKKGQGLLHAALDHIASNVGVSGESVIVFNQLGFLRNDVIEMEGQDYNGVYDGDKKMRCQRTKEGNLIFVAEAVPPKGYKVYKLVKEKEEVQPELNQEISTDFYHMAFDDHYNIRSIFDREEKREILQPGTHAGFVVFEDMPKKWDNWEISSYYREKSWEAEDVVSAELAENGEVRMVMHIKKQFMGSTLEQDIILYKHTKRIDFKTNIDWKEKNMLVKYEFPVDIHATSATYEIQYGNVSRPTHYNTSWDAAKFEVCAQKWADISESNYGVSLLNDCKYGYNIHEGVMSLTLLKSTCYPNPEADKEYQEFVFSILPHEGSLAESNTIKESYNLNCPLYAKVIHKQEGRLPAQFSMFQTDNENVLIEVVKKAEESESIVLRIYETTGGRQRVAISSMMKIGTCHECDMLENEEHELDMSNILLAPFEIKTVKIKRLGQ